MGKTNALLGILAALAGGGAALLHVQNGELAEKIRDAGEQCERQSAQLREKYRAEIDDLRDYLLEQYQTPAAAPAVAAEKPGFNQLISAGHRMQAVGRKYEFLLGSALLDAAGKKQLRGLLYEWERLTDSIRNGDTGSDAVRMQAELENTETRIRQLLTDPVDYQHFLTQRQRDL